MSDELQQRVLQVFPGLVVNKRAALIGGLERTPRFVTEFLIASARSKHPNAELGAIREGGSFALSALEVRNVAEAADGYSEKLNGVFAGGGLLASGSGSVTQLVAGQVSAGAMLVGLGSGKVTPPGHPHHYRSTPPPHRCHRGPSWPCPCLSSFVALRPRQSDPVFRPRPSHRSLR